MFNLENQLAKEFNISVKIVKNTLSLFLTERQTDADFWKLPNIHLYYMY